MLASAAFPSSRVLANTCKVMSCVKIAYLILAHDNPAHLQRLTRALSSSSSAVFIHVDRKSPLADFAGAQGTNIVFSTERIPVYWGDYSQVEAMLVLMRLALSDVRRFDYFVALSGVDYPLHSTAMIERFFERNAGAEFMSLERMPSPSKPLTRLSIYRPRPTDGRLSRLAARFAKAVGIKLRRDYEACLGKLIPYGGSSWWALSRGACGYIQDFVANEPRVIEFFKHTRCPDELLLHTILGNSPYMARIRATLTYADWCGSSGRSPPLITQKHVAAFKSGPTFTLDDRYRPGDVLFARKFCDASGPLVAELDRLRLEGEGALKGEAASPA